MYRYTQQISLCSFLVVSFFLGTSVNAQGLILPGAGAVNRSMAGASTALAIDAAGAGYWNPAVIRALPGNEVFFGAELLYADTHISSSAPGGAGSNFSDSGLASIPTIAAVYHSERLPVTLGIGIYALLGGGVNFPQVTTNPLLNATGPLYASATALGIQPSVSVQLTDRLAVGAGPIISSMSLGLNPAFFAPNAPGDFPIATPGRPFWGAGFQAGLLYQHNCCWAFGAAYKSPIWFETFKYNAQDAAGNPRELFLDQTLPQIITLGAAYRGFERATIAVDVRYLDYRNTTLWGDSIPTPGLAWDSVFSVAVGGEYQLTDRLTLRMGYLANENPIPALATLFNIQLPALNQQQVSLGGGIRLTRAVTMDMAAIYGFSSSSQGPIPIPGGPVATVGLKNDFVSAAFSLRFAY